MPSEEFEV